MTRAMKRLYGNPERLQRNQAEAALHDEHRPKRRVRRGPGRLIARSEGSRPPFEVAVEIRK